MKKIVIIIQNRMSKILYWLIPKTKFSYLSYSYKPFSEDSIDHIS